jgi:hypothetical protein
MLVPQTSALESSGATVRRLTEIVAFIRHGHEHNEPQAGPAHLLFAMTSRFLGRIVQTVESGFHSGPCAEHRFGSGLVRSGWDSLRLHGSNAGTGGVAALS